MLIYGRSITSITIGLFFGHRSLTKNKTQTAVMNMTDERIVRKKLDLLLDVSYASTYIFRSDR